MSPESRDDGGWNHYWMVLAFSVGNGPRYRPRRRAQQHVLSRGHYLARILKLRVVRHPFLETRNQLVVEVTSGCSAVDQHSLSVGVVVVVTVRGRRRGYPDASKTSTGVFSVDVVSHMHLVVVHRCRRRQHRGESETDVFLH